MIKWIRPAVLPCCSGRPRNYESTHPLMSHMYPSFTHTAVHSHVNPSPYPHALSASHLCVALYLGEEKDSLVSTACACTTISGKTWEFITVWKLSVKLICMYYVSVSSKDAVICQFDYLQLHEWRGYEAEDAFLQVPTSFGKSVRY